MHALIKNILCVSIVILSFTLNVLSQNNSYKVIAIIDGDTYDIVKNKQKIRIRIDAIDAPERGMAYYKISKNHLSKLIFGKLVTIKEISKDWHGRIVGKTYLSNKTDVSAEMLKNGMAWHYKKYSSDAILAALENQAKKQKLGLWKDTNPIAPWDIRKMRKKQVSSKITAKKKLI